MVENYVSVCLAERNHLGREEIMRDDDDDRRDEEDTRDDDNGNRPIETPVPNDPF